MWVHLLFPWSHQDTPAFRIDWAYKSTCSLGIQHCNEICWFTTALQINHTWLTWKGVYNTSVKEKLENVHVIAWEWSEDGRASDLLTLLTIYFASKLWYEFSPLQGRHFIEDLEGSLLMRHSLFSCKRS